MIAAPSVSSTLSSTVNTPNGKLVPVNTNAPLPISTEFTKSPVWDSAYRNVTPLSAGLAENVNCALVPSVTSAPPLTVTTGFVTVPSSLARLSVVEVTVASECAPDTVTVWALLTTESSWGVRVNDPVPETPPAGIMTLNVPTGANPTSPGAFVPTALTRTSCDSPKRD